MEAEIEKVKQNTEEQAKGIFDLKELLDKAIKDKESITVELSSEVANLSSQNENLKSLVESAEKKAAESFQGLASMENNIKTLSSEKQIIRNERDNLKMLVADMEKEREDLSNQLKDTLDKSTLLSLELEKARLTENEVQTLLAENQKLKNDNLMLLAEHGDLKAQLQNLDVECSKLRETISDTKDENESLIKEKDIVERKVEQLGMDIDGLNVEKEELVDNLKKKLRVAAAENEILASKHSKCLDELEMARSSVTELEKELESTKCVLNGNIMDLQNEKNSAATEIKQLEAFVKNLKRELKQQLEKISEIEKTNEGLVLANSNMQNDIIEIQQEKNKALASIVDLESTLELQTQHISNVQETNKELEVAKTNLYNDITIHQEEKVVALAQLQQVEASVKNLENQLEQQLEKISHMEKTNEALLFINSNLQNEITEIQGEKNEALTSIADFESKLEQQTRHISNLQEINKDLEATKIDLYNEVTVQQEEKTVALTQLQQVKASVKNLENQLEQQLEKISDMQKTNEASIADLEIKLDQQAQHISNLEDINEDLKAAKTDLYNEVTVYQADKTAVLAQLQQVKDNLKSLQSESQQQDKQIFILQQINEELQNANSNLHRQLDESRNNLQGEIIALERERNEVINNLQQSNASIKTLEGQLEQQSEQFLILKLANEDLQMSNTKLRTQLEETMVSHRAEVLALQDEKNKIFYELLKSNASIENLRTELEQGKEQISILHVANEDMKNNITSLDKQLEEVRSSLHGEIAVLHEEKDATLLELYTSQASVKNFESVVEKQSENISSLKQANDELQKNICTLIEQSEQAKIELQEEVKAAQEEKDTIVTQLKKSKSFIKNIKDEVARLTEELSVQLKHNSTLDKQLEEATLKVSNLSDKLEKSQADVSSHINDMSMKTKELENTINVLSSQKTKVEENLKVLIEACIGNMLLMKEFEDMIKQRITDDETRLGPLYQSLREVLSSCQKFQYAYDEMSTRASQLEVLKENQMKQIDQLEEKNNEMLDRIRLLEEEKLNTNKENTKLHRHVQDLEVQLQLVKQKLKVTMVENKWKEDCYATTVETLRVEIQNLEQLVQQFSQRVRLLEETLEEVKEHAESGVFSLAKKLDELESSFSQGFARFVYRSSTSNEEFNVLRKKLHDHLDEQKELFKKKDELAIRLRDKEKVLSEMVKNDADGRILENKVEEKESGGERTNYMTIFSRRWPSLRRNWRRNSYSAGEKRSHQEGLPQE